MIGEYLRCALDGDEPGMDLINDPKYRPLCDDAVYSVFQHVQLDFVETGSRKAYITRFVGNRPMTIPLLQQAWKSCQENERRRERVASCSARSIVRSHSHSQSRKRRSIHWTIAVSKGCITTACAPMQKASGERRACCSNLTVEGGQIKAPSLSQDLGANRGTNLAGNNILQWR